MERRHKKTHAWISLAFAFLLTVLFVILYISFGMGMGVFNSRSITNSINSIDYYDRVYAAVTQSTEELLLQAGLPDTILSDIITPGRVHVDGMNYVNEAINRKQKNDITVYEEPQSQPRYILNKEIELHILEYMEQEFIEQKSIRQSAQFSEEIATIVNAIEYDYNNKVQLKFVDYLMNYKIDYNKIMIIMIPSLILLISILCYMLIRIYRYRYRGIRFIVYALSASSILTIILSLYLLISRSYSKFVITPDYYNEFVSEYLKLSITVFAYIGMMGILLAILLITLIGFMRNKIINT